ncbi:MAG TPA: hypothetical protein VMF88_10660 [Bacteroidota bacterium]|nr:hypothetical protein [Bacteroidota bacterium]
MELFGNKSETPDEQLLREQELLEKRLRSLINKKVSGFEIEHMGAFIVKITFDDGTILEFDSWDSSNDVPHPEGVKVYSREDHDKQGG